MRAFGFVEVEGEEDGETVDLLHLARQPRADP
jgi:hypothetical protein